MRKMRVAMVTKTHPPDSNGVVITTGRIGTGLQARRHTVQLIRPRRPGSVQVVTEDPLGWSAR